jgi:hypothetical protein
LSAAEVRKVEAEAKVLFSFHYMYLILCSTHCGV